MKIITYGTFDLFHFGHLEILRRAKDYGDYLIVAVSTDGFNNTKGKECIFPYEQRKEIVGSIKYVDKVIAENTWEQKRKDIISLGVDIFLMGNDWEGKFDELKDICNVIYLPRTDGISTTDIKHNITKRG